MYGMLDLATFALQSLLYSNMYYYFDDYARGISAMHKRARERRVLRRSECVEFRNPRKLLCLHAPFNTSRDTVPLADLDDIEDSPRRDRRSIYAHLNLGSVGHQRPCVISASNYGLL
jgi:hypothetical protein